jgi:hypothetical protein
MKIFKDNLIWLAAIFVIVISWQMLLPGYVLTLDMVFTPMISLAFTDGAFLNFLPARYFMGFLNLFLSGWIIQKIMLVALFFSLFYLVAKFLPVPKKHYANYWAALFYSLNPFVYERFLAGHWTHLFAYAFLPPFFHYLIRVVKKLDSRLRGNDTVLDSQLGAHPASTTHPVRAARPPLLIEGTENKELDSGFRRNDTKLLLLWLLLIGIFSLHFLVMAVLIIIACFLYKFIILAKNKAPRSDWLRIGKCALIIGGLFLIASSYWIAPYFINQNKSVLNSFDQSNQLAFKTVGGNGAATIFNVLTLYGFWGERESWSNYFLSPKANPIFWPIILVVLVDVIFVGIIYTWRVRRKEAIFFLCIGLTALILALGLGISPFRWFNAWLFNNIGFWRGFRDTQKFSGLLALAYAYFGGFGFFAIAEYISKKLPKIYKSVLLILFLIPIFYTYPMIGGFVGQLKPVWYPQSWYSAKNILDNDNGDYQALFLPWHQYMSLDFNNDIITANPAKNFFGRKIIQGDNMEVGGVFSQSRDLRNLEIQNIILDNK